jgi:outer membrane murein-binding lipoprotein Lpp
MKKYIVVTSLLLSGCVSPMNDTTIVSLINNRLTNLEQKMNANPPGVKKYEDEKEDEEGELTAKQKEFIQFMMDYLGN